MAKARLDFEFEYDFYLLAIACHQRDYKLAFTVGKQLECELARVEDHQVQLANNEVGEFAHFFWENDGGHYAYHLISNKSGAGYLVPEHKTADYFFIITGMYDNLELTEMATGIRQSDVVLTAFEVDPNGLKSRDKLILE